MCDIPYSFYTFRAMWIFIRHNTSRVQNVEVLTGRFESLFVNEKGINDLQCNYFWSYKLFLQ
jgi:hypothetical protein